MQHVVVIFTTRLQQFQQLVSVVSQILVHVKLVTFFLDERALIQQLVA